LIVVGYPIHPQSHRFRHHRLTDRPEDPELLASLDPSDDGDETDAIVDGWGTLRRSTFVHPQSHRFRHHRLTDRGSLEVPGLRARYHLGNLVTVVPSIERDATPPDRGDTQMPDAGLADQTEAGPRLIL
jgi:hypothetical protein